MDLHGPLKMVGKFPGWVEDVSFLPEDGARPAGNTSPG